MDPAGCAQWTFGYGYYDHCEDDIQKVNGYAVIATVFSPALSSSSSSSSSASRAHVGPAYGGAWEFAVTSRLGLVDDVSFFDFFVYTERHYT